MNDNAYIERIIQEYDMVILASEGFCEDFKRIDFGKVSLMRRKILILSAQQIDVKEKQVFFRQIDPEQVERLCLLYHTYEFADNFILMEENSAYASILNYVRTGILTGKEAWQALLGKGAKV
ncbi:MAG: hypothetical protein HDR02_12915 [Lachnospiraceae bacterium]|nr:hypothetical protein [Lachnospiraceae bacterium]